MPELVSGQLLPAVPDFPSSFLSDRITQDHAREPRVTFMGGFVCVTCRRSSVTVRSPTGTVTLVGGGAWEQGSQLCWEGIHSC